MAQTRELVKRRKTVRNTCKITRTMEMIATAKFKKASDRIGMSAAYADRLAEMASGLVANLEGSFEDPLIRSVEHPQRTLLFPVTANRGLCGAYNVNVLNRTRHLQEELYAEDQQVELHVVGKKGITFFQFLGVDPARSYTDIDDRPSYESIRTIADELLGRYRNGDFDRLVMVYSRFESASRQEVVDEVFLPLASPTSEGAPRASREYLYDPDPETILRDLLPHSFRTRFFTVFLHAAACEQVARMVAMKNATDNAEEMIKVLTRMYNRARQSAITSEILEIMGAKAAMEG